MRVASRAPAFLLVGLVLVAATLLVAGYGAAVGIGVIVGVVLGAAAVLAFLAMNPHESSGGPTSYSAAVPDHDAIRDHHRSAMQVAGVDGSALRRLIPVGTSMTTTGVTVELLVLELREDGAVGTLVARSRPPTGSLGHFVALSVSDDVGTAYAAAGNGTGTAYPTVSRYEIRFAPSPPEGATALLIRLDRFTDPVSRSVTDGPWEFRIDL